VGRSTNPDSQHYRHRYRESQPDRKLKIGAPRLSQRDRPRYMLRNRFGAASRAGKWRLLMAAIIALGLAFGIFAILNLIDNKRLD